jgi:hypothetical protein
MNDTLLPLRLSPGSHRLEVSAHKASAPAIAQVACRAGEIRYVSLRTVEGGPRRHSVEIAVSEEMPEGLRYQALLIWGNGQWLVPQELGR